jgi:predicted ArsR family transcriptional regulator
MFPLYFTDMLRMEGFTAEEMGKILGIEENTVLQRLYVAGIKPLTKKAVYDKSALEAIRNVPGKGRPPKAKPEDAPKTAPKPKK